MHKKSMLNSIAPMWDSTAALKEMRLRNTRLFTSSASTENDSVHTASSGLYIPNSKPRKGTIISASAYHNPTVTAAGQIASDSATAMGTHSTGQMSAITSRPVSRPSWNHIFPRPTLAAIRFMRSPSLGYFQSAYCSSLPIIIRQQSRLVNRNPRMLTANGDSASRAKLCL